MGAYMRVMSSMGGLSGISKSVGKRRSFVAFCLFTLFFSLSFALLSMSGGCSSFGTEALSGTNIYSEHQDMIIAISDSGMNWNAAKAWCQHKGGRLPLINGAASLSSELAMDLVISSGGLRVDGFGFIKGGKDISDWATPWPSDLPIDHYWMGTADPDNSALPFYVVDVDGMVIVGSNLENCDFRVVCVR